MVAHTASVHSPGNPAPASQCGWAPQGTHHTRQGAEVWFSDWQGEDDQGSLLNYRLGLCTQLRPSFEILESFLPQIQATQPLPTNAPPWDQAFLAQLLLQTYGQPSLHHSISKPAWQVLTNWWLKFTVFTHFWPAELLQGGKSSSSNSCLYSINFPVFLPASSNVHSRQKEKRDHLLDSRGGKK